MGRERPGIVFDQQIFNQLIEAMGDEGRALVQNLIEVYVAEAGLLLERVGQALAEGAAEELARAAHKLRGSSLSMGANALAARCAAIEDCGLSGALDEADLTLHHQQALAELGRLCDALRAYREAHGL